MWYRTCLTQEIINMTYLRMHCRRLRRGMTCDNLYAVNGDFQARFLPLRPNFLRFAESTRKALFGLFARPFVIGECINLGEGTTA